MGVRVQIAGTPVDTAPVQLHPELDGMFEDTATAGRDTCVIVFRLMSVWQTAEAVCYTLGDVRIVDRIHHHGRACCSGILTRCNWTSTVYVD